MDDKKKRAKELFFEHNGSHESMSHNEVYYEYKQCGATDKDEEEWGDELAKLRLGELSRPVSWDTSFRRLYLGVDSPLIDEILSELFSIIKEDKHSFNTSTSVLIAESLKDIGGEHSPIGPPHVYEMRKGDKWAEKALLLAEEVLKDADKNNTDTGFKKRIQKNLEEIGYALENKYTGPLGDVVKGPWG